MATSDVREEQRSKDIEALRGELDKLRADVVAATRTARELGGTLGEQAASRVRETADRARAQVNRSAADVGHQIEERPLTSIVGAFLIGLLLGLVFGRR